MINGFKILKLPKYHLLEINSISAIENLYYDISDYDNMKLISNGVKGISIDQVDVCFIYETEKSERKEIKKTIFINNKVEEDICTSVDNQVDVNAGDFVFLSDLIALFNNSVDRIKIISKSNNLNLMDLDGNSFYKDELNYLDLLNSKIKSLSFGDEIWFTYIVGNHIGYNESNIYTFSISTGSLAKIEIIKEELLVGEKLSYLLLISNGNSNKVCNFEFTLSGTLLNTNDNYVSIDNELFNQNDSGNRNVTLDDNGSFYLNIEIGNVEQIQVESIDISITLVSIDSDTNIVDQDNKTITISKTL
jgi:hypothetical protein